MGIELREHVLEDTGETRKSCGYPDCSIPSATITLVALTEVSIYLTILQLHVAFLPLIYDFSNFTTL
jgi:hypothetical protein